MSYIVRYVNDSTVRMSEGFIGRRLSHDEIEPMKAEVMVPTEAAAKRLVEHLHLTGNTASYTEFDADDAGKGGKRAK